MSELAALADSQDRFQAETTWDCNVVVMAGAGTGKTTILVNRILNLLMREPNPLVITEIVALTFTNKAATEMKQAAAGAAPPPDRAEGGHDLHFQDPIPSLG